MALRPVVMLALAVATAGCLAGFGGTPDEPLAFTLTSTDGKALNATQYAGRLVLLDLMATWCAPCKAEMPHLREFHAANPDVTLISIDVDPTDRDLNRDPLPDFKEKFNATWDFAYDTDNVFQRSGAKIIPTFVVLGPDGKIRERITEYPIDASELARRVAAHAKEA